MSGFATDCPCDVWCRGLTICLLHVGPPLFWKSIFKRQLGCRFDKLDRISSFLLYFDICNDIFEVKMLSFGNRCLLIYVSQVFVDYYKYQGVNHIIYFKRYQAASFRNTHGLVTGRKEHHMVNILTNRCISYLPVHDLTILCIPAVSPHGPPWATSNIQCSVVSQMSVFIFTDIPQNATVYCWWLWFVMNYIHFLSPAAVVIAIAIVYIVICRYLCMIYRLQQDFL